MVEHPRREGEGREGGKEREGRRGRERGRHHC